MAVYQQEYTLLLYIFHRSSGVSNKENKVESHLLRPYIGLAMSSLGFEFASLWASASQHYREFQFAMIALLLYDHAITLGTEFDFFWCGPPSLSKVLYLLIRYLSLSLVVILVIG
ncbi:hypothetical protein EV401DRAFT_718989 [Pisolithus croceorrhizus]|nr:hypothetical protein EV401DRAFT_718989 [Pisolithus croceorrhizus]